MTQPNGDAPANAATETFYVTDMRTHQTWPIHLLAGKPKILIGSGNGVEVDIRLPGKQNDGIAPKQIILIRNQQTNTEQASQASTKQTTSRRFHSLKRLLNRGVNKLRRRHQVSAAQASAEQIALGHFYLLNLGVNRVILKGIGGRREIWPDSGRITVSPGDEISVASYSITLPRPSQDLPPNTQLPIPQALPPIVSGESNNFSAWLSEVTNKSIRPVRPSEPDTDRPLEIEVWIENKGNSDGAVFKVEVDGPPKDALPEFPTPTIRAGQRGHCKFIVRHIKSPEQLAGETKLVVRVHAPDSYGVEAVPLPLDYNVEPHYAHMVAFDCQDQPREAKKEVAS
jgi:hypothetical protein